MDFDGHQSTFGNSLFPTYQEQNSAASWSHTAHDDPYGLNHCVQNSIKNRKATDITDWDRETDLQGLVSDILDEADSQHSYYSQGSLPTRSPIWSPKTLREGLQQFYQSEAKPQHQPVFPPNFASCEASSKSQGHPVDIEEFYQQFNGLSTNQQWLFNLPNGDQDGYPPCPLKPPPGLPPPNTGNTSYRNTLAEKDRGTSRSINNMSDLSNAFRPENGATSPFFHSYHEDQFTQSSSNEHYGLQHINQLVSSFQSFMAGDFPNIQQEDNMADQWKTTSPAPAVQTPKQLLGEFGTMERNGGGRKQTFKRDTFQDLPGFRPQNADHFQPPSLNLPNQYQTNAIMSVNVDQYSKHHMQQGLMQSRSQRSQREKKRMHMSGYLGEGFSTTPPSNTNMRGGDKRQAFSQNPNFDPLGSIQSQRCDGENSMGVHRVGNTQQLMPPMNPGNDPRRYFGSTTPRGGDAPVMDVGDMMLANELAAFYSNICDLLTCRGESPYHAMMTSAMNQRELVIQLHSHLEECYEEWRCLSRERKKTEVILSTNIPGKRFTPAGNANLPKTPPNSKRIDHLILNQAREQARVASLLGRMESLCSAPLHMNIHIALSRHHVAVCIAQARRKEEVATMSKPPRHRRPPTEDRDTVLMAVALRDLTASTTELRTALWCALQMTLPKPVQRPDRRVNGEATPTDGFSFRF